MNTEKSKEGPQGPKESGNGGQNKITVKVRYQARIEEVDVNKNASLMSLLDKSIEALGQDSSQKDRFQLKLNGQVLDLTKKINDYPIEEGTLIILSLSAGGGGNYDR